MWLHTRTYIFVKHKLVRVSLAHIVGQSFVEVFKAQLNPLVKSQHRKAAKYAMHVNDFILLPRTTTMLFDLILMA